MVIVTNLYASHFGCGFALPWRYLHAHDLSAHFPQESCWSSVVSSNTRQGQPKNTEGWRHTRRTAEALTFADRLQPDGTANRAGSIRIELVTLMSKESPCWQGCWQPSSTCHYLHADWNRHNVYFTVMFLPFNMAVLFRKYCTLLSLKLDWNIRCILQNVKYAAVLFHNKGKFKGFYLCFQDTERLCVVCSHVLFCSWKYTQCKKEGSLGFTSQIAVHHT